MNTKKALVGAGIVGVLAAGIYFANKSGPQAYAGYWRPGGGLWYPCNVVPYVVYAQPDTGKASYQRYDFQAMLVTTNPDFLDKPAGQGGANHTYQYTGHDGRLGPISTPQKPSGYWLAPTLSMRNPGAPFPFNMTDYYASKNPGASLDPPAESTYSAAIASHGEWVFGDIPAFKTARQVQCSAPPPATKTPTTIPTATPTGGVPPPCPTCVPTCAPTCAASTPTKTNTPHIGPAPTKTPCIGPIGGCPTPTP